MRPDAPGPTWTHGLALSSSQVDASGWFSELSSDVGDLPESAIIGSRQGGAVVRLSCANPLADVAVGTASPLERCPAPLAGGLLLTRWSARLQPRRWRPSLKDTFR